VRASLAGVVPVDNPACRTVLAAIDGAPQNPAAALPSCPADLPMRRRTLAVLVALLVLVALAVYVALSGARPRSEAMVAEADELLGIGTTSAPTTDPERLRVVVADIDFGARVGAEDARVGVEHLLREDIDGITIDLEHYDADVVILFDVSESIDGVSRPLVRTIAGETGLRYMLATRHWSKRRAWWPLTPVFAPVGPVDGSHVIYARRPFEPIGGAVRTPRGEGLAHRLWGPAHAWMAGRAAIGPTRSLAIAVDAGMTAPPLDGEDLRLRACLGGCETDEGGGRVSGDDGHVELAFGPGFELLRAVTHGRLHGTLVHCVIYAELAITAPTASDTPPTDAPGPE